MQVSGSAIVREGPHRTLVSHFLPGNDDLSGSKGGRS